MNQAQQELDVLLMNMPDPRGCQHKDTIDIPGLGQTFTTCMECGHSWVKTKK